MKKKLKNKKLTKKQIIVAIIILFSIFYFKTAISILRWGDSLQKLEGTSWHINDTIFINFEKDGGFSYYNSGSGNAIGNTDLCPEYRISNFGTKIKLKCDGIFDKKIKVLKLENDKIVLKFGFFNKKEFLRVQD